MSISSTSGTSMDIFGSGNEKYFELQAPITPQKTSVTNTSIEGPLMHGITSQSANSDSGSSASVDPPQHDDIAAQPITPTRAIEESYGHADITPESTRYTTYLPARQQYGLLTPPKTPETLLGAFVKPTDEPSYSENEQQRRREAGSPVRGLTRKPLPHSSSAKIEIGMGYENGCATCGRMRGQNMGDCDCGEVCEQESEVRNGCLERFRFWRLKRKIERKWKDMRESISK